ncbi:MAG: hypothetical protein H6R26_1867 [Proteobacteria bacterium]|nr:hypothetical protein [Pseudomonadota bacterium]
MRKITGLAVASILFGSTGLLNAATVNVGNRIGNGDFEDNIAAAGQPANWQPDLSTWNITGVVTTRAITDAINDPTVAGVPKNQVFNTLTTVSPGVVTENPTPYFTVSNNRTAGGFVVLGDEAGIIEGTPDGYDPVTETTSETSSIWQEFVLPTALGGKDVISYALNVRFRSAFDGILLDQDGDGDITDLPRDFKDRFEVKLDWVEGAQSQLLYERRHAGVQLNHSAAHAITLPMLPGNTYRLTFSLFEDDLMMIDSNNQVTNTAVGIDNIVLSGTAEVVPVPGAIYLFGSAMGAMAFVSRRRDRVTG